MLHREHKNFRKTYVEHGTKKVGKHWSKLNFISVISLLEIFSWRGISSDLHSWKDALRVWGACGITYLISSIPLCIYGYSKSVGPPCYLEKNSLSRKMTQIKIVGIVKYYLVVTLNLTLEIICRPNRIF